MKPIFLFLFFVLQCITPFAQNRYAIVIDEIMADPSPQIGLPNNEWIELKNTSGTPINLQNWRIGDASSQSGLMPTYILQADSFVIVCANSSVAVMSSFGSTISVTNFPSLDNNGDQLFLKAPDGKIIHAVFYSNSWYQNSIKKEGGWTLEMIDPTNPCTYKDNWKASIDTKGGTPNKKNSVNEINPDTESPRLKRAYPIDSMKIILVFDEPLDSLKATTITNYTSNSGINFISATCLPPLFNSVQLTIATPLQSNVIYNITSTNISDCSNNIIGNFNKTKVALPTPVTANELVVNEILFNPKSESSDFVEFYNRSNKVFDASKLIVANRNNSGIISSQKQISESPILIFPEDYFAITDNAESLSMNYFVKNLDAILELTSLPSFPDNEGTIVLLNSSNAIIDEVKYKDDWHFKLIDNKEGISLERIDQNYISQAETNWTSAASTAGFATPGYKNSQYKNSQFTKATIEIIPKIFSPNGDGKDDIATIFYKVKELGFVANITIYNPQGIAITNFTKNATLGLDGFWNWNGTDDKKNKLPTGTYIVFTELFNLKGEKLQFKNVVILVN